MAGALRVIAGELGGRVLAAPRGLTTRPTSGRVREALFSMLGELAGARVLDLYAGTGALAIEALSRGAARAVLVEGDRAAAACIKKNLAALELETRARLLPVRVESAHGALGDATFDLVLCDPPWAAVERATHELERLVRDARLASAARVVLEHSARDEPSVPGLEREQRRVWGDTAVSFFRAPSVGVTPAE